MRTHLSALFAVLILGCGTSPKSTFPDTANKRIAESQMEDKLTRAYALYKKQDFAHAQRILTLATQDEPTKSQLDRIRLLGARIIAHSDPGRGTDAYLDLIDSATSASVREEAKQRAIQSAVLAKRCLTAFRLQKQLATISVRETLAITRCQEPTEALISLHGHLDKKPQKQQIIVAIQGQLSITKPQTLYGLLGLEKLQNIQPMIAKEILSRNLLDTPVNILTQIHRILPDKDPTKAGLNKRLGQVRVRVLLPLSGPFRPVGTALKKALEAVLTEDSEDAVSMGPKVTILDGGTIDKAQASLALINPGKRPFATIGVFDAGTASQLVARYENTSEPLIMLTVSDAAVRNDAPIWRAVHTPLLVARTIASTAIQLGAMNALIVRRDDPYGREHGGWFTKVWQNARRGAVSEVVLKNSPPDFARVASLIQKRTFDTLFVPMKAMEAAELFQHLAANQIWAKGPKPRFAATEGMREVLILGTPEWYTPKFASMTRRYGQYAIFPSIFAAQTTQGAIFAREVRRKTQRPPTAVLAILCDAIAALSKANAYHLKHKVSAVEALRQTKYDTGVTAGLDFSRKNRDGGDNRDAVSTLFMLQLGQGRVHLLGELK